MRYAFPVAIYFYRLPPFYRVSWETTREKPTWDGCSKTPKGGSCLGPFYERRPREGLLRGNMWAVRDGSNFEQAFLVVCVIQIVVHNRGRGRGEIAL